MKTWEDCVDFHGHECPGLAIGYRAAIEAAKLLECNFSDDEQLVCVTENDACGVDAIQCMLSCSVGKGNLIFRLRGKSAYSFYNRKNNKSIRLVLKEIPDLDKDQKIKYIKEQPDIYEIKDATFILPEKARIFNNKNCSKCGEKTMEAMLRVQDNDFVCLDCFQPYTRSY